MRLTLRTLLAYLDDTMDPAEIKEFGKRVAESDAAQELIARIRQITRRRRLTAPPATGPNAFDPNTVADYLDNKLSNEQVAELEKTCLESDVHLAEIAAAHQILTLVLGQPALVPPTARERMYALVHGREAIPFRKASSRLTDSGFHEDGYEEEGPPSSVPLGKWLRWALPVAALILLVGGGIYLMQQELPSTRLRGNNQVAVNNKGQENAKDPTFVADPKVTNPDPKVTNPDPKVTNPDPKVTNPDPKVTNPDNAKPDDKNTKPDNRLTIPDQPAKPDKSTDPDSGRSKPPVDPKPPVQPAKRPEPSTEHVDIGVFSPDPRKPTILVQKRTDGGWKRLTKANPTVNTQEPLVSLPGYASEVALNSGVNLLLRGHIPEFSQLWYMDSLFDSAVIVHKTTDFQADLTLLRGRLYISTKKPNAKVRVRFGGTAGRSPGEIWDLTLQEAGTEVGLDLIRLYLGDSNWVAGEEPRTIADLCVLKGKLSLKIDTYFYNDMEAPPGAAVYMWDNEGPRPNPTPINEIPAFWTKDVPVSTWKAQLRAAEAEIQKQPPDKARELRPARDNLAKRVEAAEAMQSALGLLSDNMVGMAVGTALSVNSEPSKENRALRLLSIYAMSAIDDVGKLIDTLASDAPNSAPDRDGATLALRRWLSRGPDQGKLLYDSTKKTGLLLVGNRFTPQEADRILTLLHDFSTVDSSRGETFELLVKYLGSDRPAIRQLAYWHLLRLSQGAAKMLPFFDAAAPAEAREQAVAEWDKLVKDGVLPPRPPEAPPMKK